MSQVQYGSTTVITGASLYEDVADRVSTAEHFLPNIKAHLFSGLPFALACTDSTPTLMRVLPLFQLSGSASGTSCCAQASTRRLMMCKSVPLGGQRGETLWRHGPEVRDCGRQTAAHGSGQHQVGLLDYTSVRLETLVAAALCTKDRLLVVVTLPMRRAAG